MMSRCDLLLRFGDLEIRDAALFSLTYPFVMPILPSADNDFLQSMYPPGLELRLVQILHRHGAMQFPVVHQISVPSSLPGERTPVRRRLTEWILPVWNLCAANDAMFASILQFDAAASQKTPQIGITPVRRVVEAEEGGNAKRMGDGACFYGQLTNIGRQSMSEVGARLREIYVNKLNFLPSTLDPRHLYLRSSDFTRTQESLQQLVAEGLYPKQNRPDHDFVFKIHTRDFGDENIFPQPNCRRLDILAKQFTAAVANEEKARLQSISERLKGIVKEVTLDSHPSANGILDTIIAAQAHSIPIPPAFDPPLIADLEHVVVREWFAGYMQSEEMRRLGLGRLAGEIKDRAVRRAEGRRDEEKKREEEDLKLAIYAGHDTSIGSLLILLDAYDNKWPPFSSIVIFELLQDTTSSSSKTSWFRKADPSASHYIRVHYNDRVLQLPGCADPGKHHPSGDASLCTLEAFKELVQKFVPKDYYQECKKTE
ncbi:histidine phosphatase superfamily [Endogone sp. FLAS-F59071]|nr:histidine phosphatase superfamily [Endogone sp. FLAS-F59071]|eukprot:RUS16144.1 histidine phosphatase superfamily [Endogone sp. FLAS-F59071]